LKHAWAAGDAELPCAHAGKSPQRIGGRVKLPRIDEHAIEVDAPSDAIWRALIARDPGTSDARAERFARILGCDPAAVSGEPGEPGSTVPGFQVAHSDPPRKLALAGSHRFSDYTLEFSVEDLGAGRSRLRAITHAAFPGLKGEIYKTLVIRSRAHVLVTKRLLQSVARRAERETLDS
jgi:hypothetical protein